MLRGTPGWTLQIITFGTDGFSDDPSAQTWFSGVWLVPIRHIVEESVRNGLDGVCEGLALLTLRPC